MNIPKHLEPSGPPKGIEIVSCLNIVGRSSITATVQEVEP